MASPNSDPDARIVAAARLGQSHESLAAEHHVSRPRITQIVAAASPQSVEETTRQQIAARLRSRWNQLEKLVRSPPEMHSAIGRVVIGSDGNPVINASVVVQAIKTQLQIEQQYRAMFGVDLGTKPGPVMDEQDRIHEAEILAVERYRATLAPLPALPPYPPGYATMAPAQQAQADVDRRRVQLQAQQLAIDAAPDNVVDAEIVD